jgi:hypothetical protein
MVSPRTQFLIDLNKWKAGKMTKDQLRKNWTEGKYPKDDWARFYLKHYGVA